MCRELSAEDWLAVAVGRAVRREGQLSVLASLEAMADLLPEDGRARVRVRLVEVIEAQRRAKVAKRRGRRLLS